MDVPSKILTLLFVGNLRYLSTHPHLNSHFVLRRHLKCPPTLVFVGISDVTSLSFRFALYGHFRCPSHPLSSCFTPCRRCREPLFAQHTSVASALFSTPLFSGSHLGLADLRIWLSCWERTDTRASRLAHSFEGCSYCGSPLDFTADFRCTDPDIDQQVCVRHRLSSPFSHSSNSSPSCSFPPSSLKWKPRLSLLPSFSFYRFLFSHLPL